MNNSVLFWTIIVIIENIALTVVSIMIIYKYSKVICKILKELKHIQNICSPILENLKKVNNDLYIITKKTNQIKNTDDTIILFDEKE